MYSLIDIVPFLFGIGLGFFVGVVWGHVVLRRCQERSREWELAWRNEIVDDAPIANPPHLGKDVYEELQNLSV